MGCFSGVIWLFWQLLFVVFAAVFDGMAFGFPFENADVHVLAAFSLRGRDAWLLALTLGWLID